MKTIPIQLPLAAVVSTFFILPSALAFEGHIRAEITRGSEPTSLLYTVGTNQLRIEVTATNWPHPVTIIERRSGAVTLLFPNNRSFVRLKNVAVGVRPAIEGGILPPGLPRELKTGAEKPNAFPPGETPGSTAGGTPAATLPAPPGGLPPGIGPQAQASPGAAGMPAMPAMPMMPMPGEKMELKATGQKTNLLGYACERFELKQRGETLEIWATDKLFPFQPYQQNQPHRFGPRMIEEQWPGLLKERKLFPLLVTLRFESGPERFRFEVKSIKAEKITDAEGNLFQPPADYNEIEPLPF